MKKIISALIALSMISIPATANAGDRRWGVDNNRHSPYYGRQVGHERHRKGCGTLCGIIIGGVIVGAIANSNRRSEPRYESRYEPRYEPQYVCQNEYVRDYNGNYILDQYGRAIFNQRCWYQ